MAKRIVKSSPPQQVDQSGMGATAIAAGTALASGAGGVTVTSCAADDKSFYCQFVKGFNVFKMILFILVILGIAYVLYVMYFRA